MVETAVVGGALLMLFRTLIQNPSMHPWETEGSPFRKAVSANVAIFFLWISVQSQQQATSRPVLPLAGQVLIIHSTSEA